MISSQTLMYATLRAHRAFSRFFRCWLPVMAALAIFMAQPQARAQSFTIDTSAASPLTGLWWNASESGWGATITQQSYMMFVTWFVYDAAANPAWYTVSCTISGVSCTGDLLKIRGGSTPTASWNGNAISSTKVGSMTLTFSSNDAATVSYTLDGVPGSRQIARQIFGPPPAEAPTLAGPWLGTIIETRSNCSQAQNNGSRATYGQFDIGVGAGATGALVISLAGITSIQCNYNGTYSTNGARLMANGTLTCSDGKRGTWQSTNMQVGARSMSLEFTVQLDTTETCTVAAVLGGSRP